MMQIAVTNYARQLVDQYGSRALIIAGQRRRMHEEKGEHDKAALWRRIRVAVEQMRGAAAGEGHSQA